MKNLHTFKIKYIGPTDTKGSRVKITSERYEQSVVIDYGSTHSQIFDVAIEYLNERGFDIQFTASGMNNTVYLMSEAFKPLKELK
jgi:hypothetical protein